MTSFRKAIYVERRIAYIAVNKRLHAKQFAVRARLSVFILLNVLMQSDFQNWKSQVCHVAEHVWITFVK